MFRISTVAGLVALASTPALAECILGSVDYQNCLYRELMNSTPHQNDNEVWSRPNPQGGFDYSNGVTCRRNPFGGLDCR